MQQAARLGARALGVAFVLFAACRPSGPAVVIHAAGGPVRVEVEVADTPAARTQGLMYRKELAADRGMLFVFGADEEHPFWMKNTILSLDMIFIGADGRIVGIREHTEPLSLKPISVGAPSRTVLEVPAGFTERHRVKTGDAVTYQGLRSHELP